MNEEGLIDVDVNYYEPKSDTQPVQIGYTTYETGTNKIIEVDDFDNIHEQIILEYESIIKQ